MGKKAKVLKIKQHKLPEEKFLVVTNPSWGVYNFDDADFNHIGAWFDRMLKESNRNTRIKAIYYQRTHRNIIVELPKETKDVELLLGAHFYSKIFLNVPVDPLSDEVANIYEYKYASFGDPAKSNFAIKLPEYDEILPINVPYPPPSPAPPPPLGVSYARAIPPEVNERIANRLSASLASPGFQADPPTISQSTSGSSDSSKQISGTTSPTDNGKGSTKEITSVPSDRENRFIEYVRPACLNSMVAESSKDLPTVDSSAPPLKKDPYDEEEETKKMLKTSDDNEYAHMFLTSIISGVKIEETADAESKYIPSSELLNALGSLPEGLIEPIVGCKAEETEEKKQGFKLEPTETCLSSNYQPSGDLLAALATLPDSMDSSRLWKKPGLPESPNKRHIQDVLCGTQPESPKRIKRET